MFRAIPINRHPHPFVFLAAAVCLPFADVALGQFVEPDVTVLHTFTSPAGGAFGWAVADLNDIDGDGVKEAIISDPFDPQSGTNSGRVFVYSGRTGQLLWTFIGQLSWQFGYAIADAGDVNADGIPDIIVGAPGSGAGRAIVYSGADGSVLLTRTGEASGDFFGRAVAGVGDLNADGHGDIAVGAPGNDAAASNAGRVYVYSGVDGALIRTFSGPSASAAFGSGVARAGDLNHDGVCDLIVGAPVALSAPRGRAYVYSGADGALLLPAFQPDQFGISTFGQFFVADAGDVNADGTEDLYVGAYDANGGAGRAFVYSGVTGALLHVFGGDPGAGMGPGRGAGDVNHDGHADLIIGSYTSNAGGAAAGKIEIYSGLDGSRLRSITSTTPGENLGFDAVGLGDVNGDCAADLLCSAASGNTVYLIAGTPQPILADVNCDCGANAADVQAFVLALTDPAEYAATYPACPLSQADLTADGKIDGDDISPFCAQIVGP